MTLVQLHNNMSELKNALSNPCIHISEHFDKLRNNIDIASIELTQDKRQTNNTINLAIENQLHMINRIDEYEKECLRQLPTNQLDKNLGDEIIQSIKELEPRLEELTLGDENIEKKMNYIDERIYESLLRVENQLFLGKRFIFLRKESVLRFFERFSSRKPRFEGIFGILLISGDQYFGYKSIDITE